MHCRVCNMDYSSPSCGGPGICPSCDCGVPPKEKRLRMELAKARSECLDLTIAVEYWKAKAEGRTPQGFTPKMLAIAEAM